jgi:hypothetical protein
VFAFSDAACALQSSHRPQPIREVWRLAVPGHEWHEVTSPEALWILAENGCPVETMSLDTYVQRLTFKV